MVFAPTLGGQFWWLSLLALASFVLILTLRPLGIVVMVISVLFALGQLMGNRIVLDKATQSIIIEKRHFLLIHTQRVIPFSEITSVEVHHHEPEYVSTPYGGEKSPATWDVYLCTLGGRIKIANGEGEWGGRGYADAISRFIGKGPLGPTREEAVVKWRERAERDAEKKKKQGH